MILFIFTAAVVAAYPVGRLLRRTPRYRELALVLLGLLPFLSPPDINFASHELYRGDSRGFEVTAVDVLALSLFVALPRPRHASPFRVARYAYLVAALVSVTLASYPLFALFSVWKVVRMYFLLAVVNRACDADAWAPTALLRGMMLGVVTQALVALFQRYAWHVHQTPGLFPHQNSMATAVNLVVPVALALAVRRGMTWLPASALAAGTVAVALSLSRGALTVFVFVTAATYAVFLARRISFRTLTFAVLGMFFAAGLIIRAGDTIFERFRSASAVSAEDRLRFNEAASLMLREHRFGVGMNQYSLVLARGGYFARVGLDHDVSGQPDGDRFAGIAHNIYWLTLAEMGYLGLFSLFLVLFGPLWLAFRRGWRARGTPTGDLLLALAIGLAGLHATGLLEWVWRQTALSYLFWMVAGMIAALARHVTSSRSDVQGRSGVTLSNGAPRVSAR